MQDTLENALFIFQYSAAVENSLEEGEWERLRGKMDQTQNGREHLLKAD